MAEATLTWDGDAVRKEDFNVFAKRLSACVADAPKGMTFSMGSVVATIPSPKSRDSIDIDDIFANGIRDRLPRIASAFRLKIEGPDQLALDNTVEQIAAVCGAYAIPLPLMSDSVALSQKA